MRIVITLTTTIILLPLSLAAGCSATGKTFTLEPVPDDKARVYIYRNESTFGGVVSWELFANDRPLTHVVNGGYYAHEVEPGSVEYKQLKNVTPLLASMYVVNRLLRDTKPLYTLNAAPGNEYFLSLQSGLFAPELTPVSKEHGLRDLRKLKALAESPQEKP